jgi:hypothetical protein
MIKNPCNKIILLLAANIFCLPMIAFANDSSEIKPKQFVAQTQQSYVKYDKTNCVDLVKQGKKIEGDGWRPYSKFRTSFDNNCPKDRPVMVAMQKGYEIQTGNLSAVTGMSQNAVVKCCPMGQKWVDSKTVA